MGTAVFHSVAHREGTIEGKREGGESRRIHGRVSLFFTRSHFERQPRREHNRAELASLVAISLDCSPRGQRVSRLRLIPASSCFSYVTHRCQSTDSLIYDHRPFILPLVFVPSPTRFPPPPPPLFIVPLSTIAISHAAEKKGVERLLLKIATIIIDRCSVGLKPNNFRGIEKIVSKKISVYFIISDLLFDELRKFE